MENVRKDVRMYSRQNKTYQDVHGLILRTCGYIILHGRRVFADVIRDLDMGRLVSVAPVLITGRHEGQSHSGRCDDGSRK